MKVLFAFRDIFKVKLPEFDELMDKAKLLEFDELMDGVFDPVNEIVVSTPFNGVYNEIRQGEP